MRIASLLCVAFLAACGSGSDPAGAPGDIAALPQQDQVVVSYDLNGDEFPDTLTIDLSGTILEAIESTAGGEVRDATDLLQGQKVDPAIADAVAAHIANSVALASGTRLDLLDSSGNAVTVTVFE